MRDRTRELQSWGYPIVEISEQEARAMEPGVVMESFPFDQAKPRYSMWALKLHGLPPLYWNGMLRGRA